MPLQSHFSEQYCILEEGLSSIIDEYQLFGRFKSDILDAYLKCLQTSLVRNHAGRVIRTGFIITFLVPIVSSQTRNSENSHVEYFSTSSLNQGDIWMWGKIIS